MASQISPLRDASVEMTDGLFAVYVHWPFCKAKCPYCDFNSHVSATIDQADWRAAYAREIAFTAEAFDTRPITSVFFGGGTPSLMEPQTIGHVLQTLQDNIGFAPDCEITLEANPTSIEADKFMDFRAAGVNRVSVGVQALNDRDLKFLGREHSADEAVAALRTACSVFERVSFDLIYARPEQTISGWCNELAEAIQYARGNLSLYQLTIEQGTPFYARHERGEFRIPEADQAGEFYEVTQDICAAHNLPAYEISNHAAAGQESRHNLTYWRYGDYLGIGPGAHGRVTQEGKKLATRCHRAPDIYLKQTRTQGHGYHPFEDIIEDEQFIEKIMMGLRLREGISLTQAEWQRLAPQRLNALISEGLLQRSADRLWPTQAGMQRLNGILRYLL